MKKRRKSELAKRYLFLFIGLLINAFGVVLMTKSYLGTSPVSSIPFVISEKYPVSLGTCTFIFYLIMFLVQAIILGKKIKVKDFIQLPLSVLYAVFIDICVSLVTWLKPETYILMLTTFVIGCVFRAIGVSIQVVADVAMLSSEAFMLVLSRFIKKEFSIVKLVLDGLMVVVATILSIALLGEIVGIREGTLIAAILTAPLSRLFSIGFEKVDDKFISGNYKRKLENKLNKDGLPYIITLSSQSGSGGHAIARILSEEFKLPLYDNDLIDMITKEGNFQEGYVRTHMERIYTNKFWEFFKRNYNYVGYSIESYEPLYEVQTQVIEKIAERGSSIIVGYCSEYILRNRENVISIYVHASEEAKLKFLKKEYNVEDDKALDIMQSHDRERGEYFRHFTGEEWVDPNRFSISIDSSLLGIDDTAMLLKDIINKMQKA